MSSKYMELQEDEKIAIQSIFEEAVFETNAWKIWKPIEVKIYLLPTESGSRSANSQNNISLTLTVSCGESYPDVLPTLRFENVRGIKESDVSELKEKLNTRMQELTGQSMILDLCDLTRLFLYEKDVQLSLFHEDMVRQKALEASNKTHCKANNERREFETIVEERELKKSELEWRKDVGVDCKNMEVRLIGPHSVYVKSKKEIRPALHHNCEEWRGVFQDNEVLVSEWTFHHTRKKTAHSSSKQLDVDECNKLITEIQNHLRSYLIIFGKEQTIVPVLFAELEKRAVEKNSIHFTVYIGQKIGSNDFPFPDNPIHTASLTIKKLATHAVLALRFLHNRQISHGSLSVSSVWHSDGSFIVSDAVFLSLMCWATNSFTQLCSECTTWNSFVNGDSALRKKDACALASLLDGLRLKYSSQLSICPYNECLEDFISFCQSAKSMEELLEHEFLILDMFTTSGSIPQYSIAVDGKKSRMMKDFVCLRMLGRGGFGHVVLAKNKLDSSNYAIKIIPLYPKNKKLNRKIAKEAELVSQLNHPNVVRYYNSWIEEVSTVSSDASQASNRILDVTSEDSILPSKLQNIENRCQSLHPDSVEWSTSYRQNSAIQQSSCDDESSCDEIENRRNILLEHTEDSFEICFENSGKSRKDLSEKPLEASQSESSSIEAPAKQLLYIQMEYCEQSTLRGFIDKNELHKFPRKIWKLFNDMLKGIQYIHDRQMIHRDITPSNILIDAAGNAKIGDFGLATHLFLQKDNEGLEIPSTTSYLHLPTQTRDIGTELYMAPELFVMDSSKQYDSKIDVYSCGVVLFEMFYRPLPPGQDRLSTIRALKTSGKVPENFGEGYAQPQANLGRKFIESMLKINADERPTIQELVLNDERPIVEMSDENFQQTFKTIMKKKNGSMFYSLMDNLFDHTELPAKKYYYDNDMCHKKYQQNSDTDLHVVKSDLTSIFSLRCFLPLNNHLLTPDSSISNKSELKPKIVKLIDQAGFIVNLPVDLKYNFVRYCVRNSINRYKRFTFDRVFTKQDAIVCHPNERWDCSVDCIGAESASLTLSVELLCCINDICNELLSETTCSIRFGDTRLIEAALTHLTVKADKREDILFALHKLYTSQKPISNQARVEVVSALLGPKVASSFISLLPIENSFTAFKDGCKILLNSRNTDVRLLAVKALQDMEKLFSTLHSIPIFNSDIPGVIFDATTTYRPTIFQDGLIFVLYLEQINKKGHVTSVVLAGGRYDSMLTKARQSEDLAPPHPLCLIGCSISLNILSKYNGYVPDERMTVICSINSEFQYEKFKLAKVLKESYTPVDIFHDPIECIDSLFDYLRKKQIQNALIIFGSDKALVIHCGIDQGKQTFNEAVKIILKPVETSAYQSARSARIASLMSKSSEMASFANCNFSFADSCKIHARDKKRFESKVKNKLAHVISLFANSCKIEVCINSLSSEMIKTIAGSLKQSTEKTEMKSLFETWGKQYGKCKQDLESVYEFCNEVYGNRSSETIIVLYSFIDDCYKAII